MNWIVTRQAPDFTAQAVMPDDSIRELTLSSFRGRYVLLLFYPLDFSPVCPKEIVALERAMEQLRARDTEVLAISVDSQFTHLAWKRTAIDAGGIGDVSFPLVADLTKEITRSYGILFNDAVALRGLFIVDREGIVRHAVVNDLPFTRSIDEAIRTLDAIQLKERDAEACT